MVYFEDFTPYCYGTFYGRDRLIALDEVLTIGWLENGHDYSQEEVDKQTLLKLRQILVMAGNCAILAKGSHYCDFCEHSLISPRIHFEWKEITLGHAEVWLPSVSTANVFYAAPNLIYHYIVKHGYRPPNEFLDAVHSFDLDSNWNAWDKRWELLEKHRNCIRRAEQKS